MIIPATHRDQVGSKITKVKKGLAACSGENTNITKKGKEIFCEWMHTPFENVAYKHGHVLCMARDITERKQLESELERSAHYDALTQLPNRALILDLLKKSIAAAKRRHTAIGILFIDLDAFKKINDTFGHSTGDLVLRHSAQVIQQSIREVDYIGRLAGDEFLALLHDVGSATNANSIAQKIRIAIRKPVDVDGREFAVDASIGVSIYPDDSQDIDVLIHMADKEMYKEKDAKSSNQIHKSTDKKIVGIDEHS